MRRILPILFFPILVLSQNHAVFFSDQFEKIQINNNSKQDNVYCIAEDDAGYIWVAEQAGLYRFDGDRFTSVTLPIGLGTTIGQLAQVNKDTFLLATQRGLGILNTKNFSIDTRFFDLDSKQYFFENNTIRWILKGKQDTFWVFTSTAVHLLDKNLKLVGSHYFKKHPNIQNAHPSRPTCFPVSEHQLILRSFFQEEIAQKNNWDLIDIKKNTSTKIKIPFLEEFEIRISYQIDADRFILISGDAPGKPQYFFLMDYEKKALKNLMQIHPYKPVSDRYQKLTYVDNGINFSQYNRGFFYDTDSETIVEEYRNFKPYGGYHKMRNGMVYAYDSEGLYRLTPHNLSIETLPVVAGFFKEIEFKEDVVDFLKYEGTLYIATQGRHIFAYDSVKGTVENIKVRYPLVWNFSMVEKGEIRVGTQGGLFMYNTSTKKMSKWKHKGLTERMGLSPITMQFLDSHGLVWMGLGSGNGLLSHNTKNNSLKHYLYDKNKFPLRGVFAMAEDKDQNIWMGYPNGGGLIKWNRGEDSFNKIKISPNSNFTSDQIFDLAIDHRNKIWIGTYHGLFVYDPQLNTFKKYFINNGLIDDNITQVFQDKNRRIWIGTNNGITVMDYDTERILNLDRAQGIPGKRIEILKPWDEKGDKLFVGATDGFCLINVNHLNFGEINHKLYTETIKVNGQPIQSNSTGPISLNYKQNHIAVNFGIVNHSDGRRNKYFYKISQLDTSWIELKTRGELQLAGMGPGLYNLSLKVCINDSNCIENEDLSFKIDPPFWGSWWFIATLLLLSVGLTATFYKIRIVGLKNIENIRRQISSDLHDDVGASISSVRILTDFLSYKDSKIESKFKIIDSIKEQSNHIGEVLEDIIWNINPKNDRLSNLIGRMQRHANETIENAEINLIWEQSLESVDTEISAIKRKELYLFFKETLNNLVKHSHCTSAWVSVITQHKKLILNIRDDGVGFDTTKNYSSNGLISMQNRSKNLKGSLSIDSKQSEGTSITLHCPI